MLGTCIRYCIWWVILGEHRPQGHRGHPPIVGLMWTSESAPISVISCFSVLMWIFWKGPPSYQRYQLLFQPFLAAFGCLSAGRTAKEQRIERSQKEPVLNKQLKPLDLCPSAGLRDSWIFHSWGPSEAAHRFPIMSSCRCLILKVWRCHVFLFPYLLVHHLVGEM